MALYGLLAIIPVLVATWMVFLIVRNWKNQDGSEFRPPPSGFDAKPRDPDRRD
jgi:hypothetical protein